MTRSLTILAAMAIATIALTPKEATAQQNERSTIFTNATREADKRVPLAKTTSATYTLQVLNEPYAEMINGTSLHGLNRWNDPDNLPMSLQFPFVFFNSFADTFFIGGKGAFMTTGIFSDDLTNSDSIDILAVMTDDITDRAYYHSNPTTLSPITYKVVGTAPNRIQKLQWKKAGVYYDTYGQMYFNFQVWLYEGSNNIDIRYGPSNIDDSVAYPYAGAEGPTTLLVNNYISSEDSVAGSSLVLAGAAASPSLTAIDLNSTAPPTLVGTPANGMVYRFVYNGPLSITKASIAPLVTVGPNPSSGRLRIAIGNGIQATVSLTDLTGKILAAFHVRGQSHLDMTSFASGLYLLKVTSEGLEPYTQSIVKQ